MDLITILTIIALSLNLIALCVVAYQTNLNRKALLLARESIEESRKARQIEMLPRAGFIYEARYHLRKWSEDLEKLQNEIKQAHKTRNHAKYKAVSEKALRTSKGLVNKFFYEKAPQWLSEIVLAGAQYYYDCHAPMKDLWLSRDKKPFWDLAPDLLERFDESIARMNELLSYIDQVVPEACAQAPASLNEHDFID